MTRTEERMREAFAQLADEAPHDPDLMGTVRSRSTRPGPGRRTRVAVAATATLLVGGLLVTWSAQSRHTSGERVAGGSTAYHCPSSLAPTVLPRWARDGFSDPEPRLPFVLGRDHEMGAVVFGDPLVSPPERSRSNKILWVPRGDAGPLTITATRSRGSDPVVIRAQTGPSIIDLPAAGCWHLELSWGARSDSLNLRYHDQDG